MRSRALFLVSVARGFFLASTAWAAVSAASITPRDTEEVVPLPICRAACVHDSRGEMPRADEPTCKPGGKPAIVTTVKSDEDAL